MRQRIDNLGAIGLNSDVAPTLLPPNACTRLLNCVPREGALQNAPGETKIRNLDIEPVYHTAWVDPEGDQWLIVSDGLEVHAYDLDPLVSPEIITPDTGPMSGGRVTFANLNGVLVINSQSDGPFYWPGPKEASPTPNSIVPLPGWDPTWRCIEMDAYRYHLVAVGIKEGDDFYPHKVRWSTFAEEGAIPGEWIPQPSNEAGDDLLGDTPGIIMGSKRIRDKLFIVKEDGVYEMVWIGGQYIMQIQRLQGTVGTTAPNGFAELAGALVVMSSTDLLLFDGQRQRSISDARVRKAFFENLSEENWKKARVFYHAPTNQLFLAAVEAGYTQLSNAVIYNAAEDSWGQMQLNRGYGFDIAYAQLRSDARSYDDQSQANGAPPYDGYKISYDKGLYQPSVPDIVVYESDEEGNYWVSFLAQSYTKHDGTPKTSGAERVCVPLEGSDGMAMVKDVWLDMDFDDECYVQIGVQNRVGGDLKWGKTLTIPRGARPHVDPRITGRYISWRVWTYTDKPWQLAAITIDWERAGDR